MVGLEDMNGSCDTEQNREQDGRRKRWTVRPVVVRIIESLLQLVERTSRRAEKAYEDILSFWQLLNTES